MSSLPVRVHTKWPVALVLGVAGSVLVGIVLLAFLWPTKTSTVQDLPVSIAGPSATTAAFEDGITEASPDTFDFVAADDRADAVHQIETRRSYGAVVFGAAGAAGAAPEVLTAPAANAAATQLLTGVAAQLQEQARAQASAAGGDPSGVTVTVTPVVPLSEDDPTGAGLAAASFPLVMGGMIGGILISLLVVGPVRRLAALGAFGVAVGFVLTLVMQTWWHYLQGEFWLDAAAMSLSVLGISAFIVGCTSLLGTKGIAIGAVLSMLVANPLSAANTPWQFIVQPWGAIGQFLVPGASNWLVRSLSYFPDTDLAQQWLTLAGWVALGLVLTVAGHFRSRRAARVPEATIEHEGHALHRA